jgi:hypothetical protein
MFWHAKQTQSELQSSLHGMACMAYMACMGYWSSPEHLVKYNQEQHKKAWRQCQPVITTTSMTSRSPYAAASKPLRSKIRRTISTI